MPDPVFRIGLLGRGTVGGAFADLVTQRADAVANVTGLRPEISGVLRRSEGDFDEILAEAAHDAHATLAVVEKRRQARDHPVLLGVPETFYLKALVLRRLD